MLDDIFREKRGFKLVCGAGNEDLDEIEKLVYIYSLAGCNFFDVCAKKEVVLAAKSGLKRAGIEKDRYLCVSVGISGDPHITKAKIDPNKCIKCASCLNICPHGAIDSEINVIKQRCLGCCQCEKICPKGAITMESQIREYKDFLPELINLGIDAIEFHAISTDENDVDEKWAQLNEMFDGMLIISLDRSELGDKRLVERVKRLIRDRKPYTTVIQADGIAMSGNNDEYGTTLQAVATAQMFQNAKLPCYIMISGGTNTKTMELAALCSIDANCLAVGSYARKIIKEYLEKDNLFDDKNATDNAVKIAKSLVNGAIEKMSGKKLIGTMV